MSRVGLIVAVEMFAVFERWGRPVQIFDGLPFKACRYERFGRQIFVVRSGAGQTAAAAAAQMAVCEFAVDELWSIGVAGGLVPERKVGDICLVRCVCALDSDTEPQQIVMQPLPSRLDAMEKDGGCLRSALAKEGIQRLPEAILASGSRVVATREQRIAAATRTGAQLVDMEAHAVATVAAWNRLPCRILKGVSDGIDTPPQSLTAAFRETALKTFAAADCILFASAEQRKKL